MDRTGGRKWIRLGDGGMDWIQVGRDEGGRGGGVGEDRGAL